MPIDLDKLSPDLRKDVEEHLAMEARIEAQRKKREAEGISYIQKIDPSQFTKITPEDEENIIRFEDGGILHCNGVKESKERGPTTSEKLAAAIEARLSKISGPKNTP